MTTPSPSAPTATTTTTTADRPDADHATRAAAQRDKLADAVQGVRPWLVEQERFYRTQGYHVSQGEVQRTSQRIEAALADVREAQKNEGERVAYHLAMPTTERFLDEVEMGDRALAKRVWAKVDPVLGPPAAVVQPSPDRGGPSADLIKVFEDIEISAPTGKGHHVARILNAGILAMAEAQAQVEPRVRDRVWYTSSPSGSVRSGPGTITRERTETLGILLDDAGEVTAWRSEVRHLTREERIDHQPGKQAREELVAKGLWPPLEGPNARGGR